MEVGVSTPKFSVWFTSIRYRRGAGRLFCRDLSRVGSPWMGNGYALQLQYLSRFWAILGAASRVVILARLWTGYGKGSLPAVRCWAVSSVPLCSGNLGRLGMAIGLAIDLVAEGVFRHIILPRKIPSPLRCSSRAGVSGAAPKRRLLFRIVPPNTIKKIIICSIMFALYP